MGAHGADYKGEDECWKRKRKRKRKAGIAPSAHHSLEVWLSNAKQDCQVSREGGCGQSDQESQPPWNCPSLSTRSPTSQGSSQSWVELVSWPPW